MRLFTIILASLLVACASEQGVSAEPTQQRAANFEGLVAVQSSVFDEVQARPGIDLSNYDSVMFDDVELAFRTPDRSKQEFPLSAQQKADFHAALHEAFATEFGRMTSPKLVSQSGPNVLRLDVRVQDISASVPPRTSGRVGRAAVFLEALGEVTLVLEIFDSESGEILARAIDKAALEGAGMRDGSDMLTKWDGIAELCAHWSETTRERLEAVLGSH